MLMLRRTYAAARVYRFRGDVTGRKVLEEANHFSSSFLLPAAAS